MKTPTTIIEAAEQLEKTLKLYFQNLKRNCSVEKHGEFIDEEDSDLCLIVDGWLMITPFHATEEVPCIGGTTIVKSIHYLLEKKVLIRSYHRDDPDEYDVMTLNADLRGTIQVVEKVTHILLDNDLDHIGEQMEMYEMYQEEQIAMALQ